MMEESSGDSDPGTMGSSGSGGGTFTISGEVTRVTSALLVGDGIGDLHVVAFPTCDTESEVVGQAVVMDADLSAVDTPVAFTMSDVPSGTVHLVAFQDDDDSGANDGPNSGDPVALDETDGGVLCTEVTGTTDPVEGITIEINAVVP